jgi:hypothetical protein
MKKKFIYTVIVLLAVTSFSYAQEKRAKYCRVTIKKTFVYKVSLDLGTADLFKDSSMVNSLDSVKTNKNDVDVLDCMSRNGWSLVASLSNPGIKKIEFYFKKDIR